MNSKRFTVVVAVLAIALTLYLFSINQPPAFVAIANQPDSISTTQTDQQTDSSPPTASSANRFTAVERILQTNEGSLPQTPETFEAIWALFLLMMQNDGENSLFFELLRPTSTVFLSDGSMPEPQWLDIPLPQPIINYAKNHGVPTGTIWHNLDSIVQVDGLTLKDKNLQNVRYELQMNNITFDTIVNAGMYNANGIAANVEGLTFPDGAVEMKTSWIWIENEQQLADLSPYYYIGHAYYTNGNNEYVIGRAALSGIHYVPKVGGTWIWTTFENMHNSTFTDITYSLPISESLAEVNLGIQIGLKAIGSIFANYRLNGVQTNYTVNDESTPFLLANSQIESHFQQVSSCATCHSLAAYKSKKVSPVLDYYNIVDAQGNGTSYFTGQPPALSDSWSTMDSVWSLKRANWKR